MISIHALREEGDRATAQTAMEVTEFLSTPSARRATDGVEVMDDVKIFLSTPSARRATKDAFADNIAKIFLSTPSARRATAKTEKNISAFVSL